LWCPTIGTMPATPLSNIPAKIIAGDSVSWQLALVDYPASAGWVLSYAFRGPGSISLTGTATVDDHLVSITPAISATWAPGLYTGQAYISNGSERYTLEESLQLEVLTNLATSAANFDPRSANQKILDAIDAVLANAATTDQKEVEIAGKRITRFERDTLRKFRGSYAHKVWQERNPGQLAPTISFDFGGGR